MDAATPDRQFSEFNLDPALAETVETAPPDQIIEGILRLEDPDVLPPLFSVLSRFNRICTGRFRAAHAWTIRQHPNVISLKAPRPIGISYDGEDLNAPISPGETGTPFGSPAAFVGRGCIVAALDFGLDFAHPNFLNPDGTTRLVSFWHQGATYEAAHPNRYGYGRVFSREEINAALRASDPYQALGYHPAISDTGNGSHGTHTLDIAAGNGRAFGARAAPASNADLMFIHLSTPALDLEGDLGDSVRMLEALDHVERTARGRPWVVNLSVGRTAGSHDGTSLVEQGMHELLRLGPGRAIVQSAGNYRSANLAVEGWCKDGEYRDLGWIVDPADTTDNEIDVWYSGKDRFLIAIRPPRGTSFVEVKLGDVTDIVHEGAVVGRLYHRRNDPNNGDNHAEVFLYRGAPPGIWTLRLIGEYVISGRFHSWIERDLARPGAQSRFDEKITTQAYTLGTIATSPLVITVGAYDANAAGTPLAPFSSCGPTRDERRDKPELLAPGVAVVAARSIPRGALAQEGLLIARSGTSMAAPSVTGTVAAMFEAAGRPVTIDEIRDCLKRSAAPVADSKCTDGWGRLDTAAAIREIRGLQEAELVSAPQEDVFADLPEMTFEPAFSNDIAFEDTPTPPTSTPTTPTPPTPTPATRTPIVMFEFDVHYGFRDAVDLKLGQTVTFDRLTKHDKTHDFFNVKRDIDRMEIGTERFTLNATGLANIQTVKKNIRDFADQLLQGCRNAAPRTDITIPGVTGHPRLFPLPNARTTTAGLLVHKLHINKKFPASKDECYVWASPQAHITIPLAKVGQLIDVIKKSIGKPLGTALTGGSTLRMGVRSDHLYKAKEGVESLRKAMLTWNHTLSNGVKVDQSTFSDQLSGFLMLQASYLWAIKLAQTADKETFGKGHLPINVKTPFPEIFSTILTPTEQLIYKELFAGPTIRYRMFGLVVDHPTLAAGDTKLFPAVVGSSLTWDNLLDWTLGLSSPIFGLPGGGKVWPVAETSPLVALELRRIGFRAHLVSTWDTLIDTVVNLTRQLNQP